MALRESDDSRFARPSLPSFTRGAEMGRLPDLDDIRAQDVETLASVLGVTVCPFCRRGSLAFPERSAWVCRGCGESGDGEKLFLVEFGVAYQVRPSFADAVRARAREVLRCLKFSGGA